MEEKEAFEFVLDRELSVGEIAENLQSTRQTVETKAVLFKIRKDNGLSQDEMAEKLHVTRQAVSRWENGETTPTPETLKQISREFDVSIDTILGAPMADVRERAVNWIVSAIYAEYIKGLPDAKVILIEKADIDRLFDGAHAFFVLTGSGSGPERAKNAAAQVTGGIGAAMLGEADRILIIMVIDSAVTLDAVYDIAERIEKAALPDADILFSVSMDENLDDMINITVVAATS